RNPWHANGLEWQAPSPPGHGNFDFQPVVYRGPYEYGSPQGGTHYYPPTQPPPEHHGTLGVAPVPPPAPQRRRRVVRPLASRDLTVSDLHPSLSDRPNPWPHRWAVGLVCATFPLIWIGGLVTTYGAGMAVPDWPNTYGYNLWLYPAATWINGPWKLFVEHGHR